MSRNTNKCNNKTIKNFNSGWVMIKRIFKIWKLKLSKIICN